MIYLEHIPRAAAAIFKGAFDPLSTMRKDEFNQLICDFILDRPLTVYPDIDYIGK